MNYPTVYKFDEFIVDTTKRSLFKNGEEIDIPSKTFDFLLLLVQKNGEVVTKDQILETVWKDSFVEESNLTVQIAKLRKLLRSQKFIKTVQGIGYQFVVSVEASIDRKSEADKYETKRRSIAVLPFKNENGEEKFEYLADGLTEGLISNFSYASNFRVLARDTVFRFKNSDLGVLDVGTKLDVDYLLAGRLRMIEDRLIVSVELIKVSDGTQIWGTQVIHKISDIFEIQTRLTAEISKQLHAKFGDLPINSLPGQITQNTESYRLYLKGEYFSHKRSLDLINKAIECFQESISHDSLNSLSYIGLARCYFWMFVGDHKTFEEIAPTIKTLLKKATEISPDNLDLNVIKGRAAMNFERDLKKSELYFQKAIEVNPNHIEAYYPYSYLLVVLEKFPEALRMLDEVSKIDPFAAENGTRVARTLYYMGEYEEAILRSKKAIESDATDFISYWMVGVSLCEIGKYDDAIDYLKKSLEINSHLETLATIGYVYARKQQRSEARKIINQLEERSREEYVPNMYLGMIYSALNEKDKAFECLDSALNMRVSDLLTLKVNPRFANLQNDPRFNELLVKIGIL